MNENIFVIKDLLGHLCEISSDFEISRSKKDPFPTHRGNFRRPGRGEGNHLKNVLNSYRMSREGEGGIVNFLRGGGGSGSFLE